MLGHWNSCVCMFPQEIGITNAKINPEENKSSITPPTEQTLSEAEFLADINRRERIESKPLLPPQQLIPMSSFLDRHKACAKSYQTFLIGLNCTFWLAIVRMETDVSTGI